MAVLLHICCGPCAIYPVNNLRQNGIDIVGYFYNPNIHPYKEFSKRLDTLVTYAEKAELEIIVDERYLLEEFLQRAVQAQFGRCRECYEMRLRQTARYAKEQGFESFSTTLLVSPYQKHDIIHDMGLMIAQEEGIEFKYVDFRSGYQEGARISREMELYRQPYCGCIYSEKERYYKPGKERIHAKSRV